MVFIHFGLQVIIMLFSEFAEQIYSKCVLPRIPASWTYDSVVLANRHSRFLSCAVHIAVNQM